MIDSNDMNKKVKKAEYQARQAEAELNAVRLSKAYKIAKTFGSIKNHAKSDPVGLTKKVAHTFMTNPKKLTHMIRTGKRMSFISETTTEQTNKYQEWILLNEPDESELDEQRKQSEELRHKPLISIITPVYNPPTDVLEELIESVLEQTYPYFELCLADDYGDNQEVIQLLEKYARADDRIKFFTFDGNKGIAGASNKILEEVRGDYIALLDHDDTLSHNALYENVKMLNDKPYDIIYSDKDKIDLKGNRFDPLFKPQYSPEMMLNVNYLTHLNVMRTSIVKKIGGWDTETNGAQDWDLFLRVVGASKLIGHIPKVLYHWRVLESSTALSIDTKPYALAGQRNAVDKYLASQNIPASTYHKKTELFIDWKENISNWPITVFVHFSSMANTVRTIRHINKHTTKADYIIIIGNDQSSQLEAIERTTKKPVLINEKGRIDENIAKLISSETNGKVLFILDNIKLPKGDWYGDLVGWLSIPEVAAAGARLLNRQDLIVDSGGVVSNNIYQPIFNLLPRFYQSYIGNAEWIRNLSILSSNFFVTEAKYIKKFTKDYKGSKDSDSYFLWLTQQNSLRLVMTPHVTGRVADSVRDQEHAIDYTNKQTNDIYRNPNLSDNDPLRLFDGEPLDGLNNDDDEHETGDQYQNDAIILARSYDMSKNDIEQNKENIAEFKSVEAKNVCFVLPSFDAVYAGLMNIFTFAEYLSVERGLDVTFFILKAGNDIENERSLVIEKIPLLKKATFKALTEATPITKAFDIGIATLWSTAFVVAKAKHITRKCYFIQDNEINFYPKGTVSALVEMSYRFGLFAIANTEGLLDFYQKQYSGKGVVVTSKVDLTKYKPKKDLYKLPKKPYKIFFYARPNMPRNAFELGVAALGKLKDELGDDVEIITAGAQWNPEKYGMGGKFTNLGLIAYEAVPRLYREVDAGLMFMFSGHPGVTASELMASGCPVVVNEYDDVTWNELYVDGETCLVTLPLASEVVRNLKRCITDEKLRKKLIDGGLKKSKEFYGGYEESLHEAYEEIIGKE